jgi:hypothetical protein
MATMTITITVNAKGVTWSRTAQIEVDTALYQQGQARNSTYMAAETVSGGNALHSYSGLAALVVASKARGSLYGVSVYGSGGELGTYILPAYLPLILFSGVGGGFGGAANTSAAGTDLPDEEITHMTNGPVIGTQNTQTIAGLKAIS